MALNIKLDLCLPRDTATVPLVRHVLRHTLDEFGVTRACVADIELAITEACANVVEHADGTDEYSLSIEVTETLCEIRVTDDGKPFDLDRANGDMPGVDSERGRGVALIQAIVDHVEFESVPEAGTALLLRKQLAFDVAPLVKGAHPLR